MTPCPVTRRRQARPQRLRRPTAPRLTTACRRPGRSRAGRRAAAIRWTRETASGRGRLLVADRSIPTGCPSAPRVRRRRIRRRGVEAERSWPAVCPPDHEPIVDRWGRTRCRRGWTNERRRCGDGVRTAGAEVGGAEGGAACPAPAVSSLYEGSRGGEETPGASRTPADHTGPVTAPPSASSQDRGSALKRGTHPPTAYRPHAERVGSGAWPASTLRRKDRERSSRRHRFGIRRQALMRPVS